MYKNRRKYSKFVKDNKLYYVLAEDGEKKLILAEKPRVIEIFPTLKCNFYCKYCDRGKENSILKNFNEIKTFYNNLKKDSDFNLLNFRISGGEPSIYPKINELISFLHILDPYRKIDFVTNGIKLDNLTMRSLELIRLLPTIYPSTKKILQRNKYVKKLFKASNIPLKVNVFFHHDMSSPGKILRKNFDSIYQCFLPTLVGGTKKVYPCCRAHRLEQMYKKKYHLNIRTPGLYKKLKNIIKNTDLCLHCPWLFRDGAIKPV